MGVRFITARLGLLDGTELGQQLVAVGHHARQGASMKGNSATSPSLRDFMRRIPGQGRAQDFRIGVGRALVEVVLVVQPEADAVTTRPAAAGALAGRRLGDLLDLQLLDLVAVAVALDPREAGYPPHSGCPAR